MRRCCRDEAGNVSRGGYGAEAGNEHRGAMGLERGMSASGGGNAKTGNVRAMDGAIIALHGCT